MSNPQVEPHPPSNLPAYFDKLSKIYGRQTGNSTRDLFARVVDRIDPITADSVIHDNAAGPATATSVLFERRPQEVRLAKQIVITDMVPAMIDAAEDIITENGWRKRGGGGDASDGNGDGEDKKDRTILATVVNSHELLYSDNPLGHDTFTHSITNLSVFNFEEPLPAIKGVYRSLQNGGQAFVSTWKRFTIGEIVHEVQKRIRPDLPPMRLSGKEWYSGEAVRALMEEAGFDKGGLEVVEAEVTVKGESLDGLMDFMKGPFTNSARNSWTDEEKNRWNLVLEEVVDEEKQRGGGGVVFEMAAVIGHK